MRILDLDAHCCILGETQSGKTVFSNWYINHLPTKTFYFDIEDRGDVKGDVTYTWENPKQEIKEGIREHQHIKYVPQPYGDEAKAEAEALWHLLSSLNTSMVVCVDEVQNYGYAGGNAFDVYVRRGLKYGIHLVTIAQRPSYVSKTIITQSFKKIFFGIVREEKLYYKKYGLPYERLRRLFDGAERYTFAVWERGKLHGLYKITP